MPKPNNYRFSALGTDWVIETKDELSEVVKGAILSRLEQFDSTYSRFRDDSLVRQMAEKSGKYHFPDDAKVIMTFYKQLYDATDRKVTPLIGQTLEQAGYDKTYTLTPTAIDPTARWVDVMEWKRATVTTTVPVVLDIGAAGKGYAVDLVGDILDDFGVLDYVIDASGDIKHRGDDIQHIGLEQPDDPSKVIGVMELSNGSLCASATNRRAWGDWHHIIDPTDNTPVEEIVATWVTSSSTMIADGLATALFFVGPEKLSEWQFQYVRLYANGRVEYSSHLNGELFV